MTSVTLETLHFNAFLMHGQSRAQKQVVAHLQWSLCDFLMGFAGLFNPSMSTNVKKGLCGREDQVYF